jgi:HD-like signal output (HDOD) protein
VRVLFVEDHPEAQNHIKKALSGVVPWDIDIADTSRQAMNLMSRNSYAVVVSSVPDSVEFIRRVRDFHPTTARIVRSAEDDIDARLRALFASHQIVEPDIELGKLVGLISQAVDLEMLIQDEGIRKLVGRVEHLPSQPKVYGRLVQMLKRPDANFRAVGKVVESDVAISTEIIRVANTPYFSRGRGVRNVIDAVGRLGTRTVRDLVLAQEVFMAVASGPNQKLIEKIHRHSVDVAVAARAIVSRPKDRDDAFLAGLLHDVGRLVVASELPAASPIVDSDGDIEQEQSVIGVTHAELGAYLTGLWGLPYQIVWATAAHHEAEVVGEGPLDVAAAVYVAEQVLNEADAESVPSFAMWRSTAHEALGMGSAS